MTLEEQIRQRWGQYGNWQSADQDQVGDLARLLQANGVADLSKLNFKKREYETPAQEWETQGGTQRTEGSKRTTFDVLYGDQNLGFLGDINRDGSLSKLAKDYLADGSGPQLTDRGDNGNILGWSSRGGGHTNFNLVENPQTGEVVVMPNWGSSKTNTYNDIRGIGSILGLAAGAYFAPAGGAAGAAAQGGLQGYGLGTAGNLLMNPNGDVNSLVKSGIAGGVTGAIGGGIKGYGAEMGWNPSATRALTGGANAALRGGDGGDILKGAVGGYLSGSDGIKSLGPGAGDMKLENGFFDSGGAGYAGGGNGMDFSSSFDPSLFDFGGGGGYDFGGWSNNFFGDSFGNSPVNFGNSFDPSIYDFGQAFDGNVPDFNYPGGGSGGGIDWGKLGTGAVKWLTTGSGADGKGAPPWAMLLGAGLGAFDSKDKEQTQSRAPWEPAQPFLKQQIAQGQDLSKQYQQKPFSAAQQTAYGNMGGLLDAINANAGGLLGGYGANASGQNQFVRGQRPTLTGSQLNLSGFMPGLLGNYGTRG